MPSNIRIVSDIDECADLWQKYYTVECLFDLWQVREIFAKIYNREIFFVVYEKSGVVKGLLPLCKAAQTENIETTPFNPEKPQKKDKAEKHLSETVCYTFFPGEIWHNRTWMEQNKIIAPNCDVMRDMLLTVKSDAKENHGQVNVDIRYLSKNSIKNFASGFGFNSACDEIGYLFYPANYDYSYEKYLASFSGKSRKKILSEVKKLEQQGISFRFNNIDDLDIMFQLNINNFGEYGYFHDPKFLSSFKSLAGFLQTQQMLRVVTVIIDNQVAAVDMGAVWNNNSIMLAGGTNKNFPGVAKVINLHHIEWASAEKLDSLDFLCGDFGWKERFHLTPRELYQITLSSGI